MNAANRSDDVVTKYSSQEEVSQTGNHEVKVKSATAKNGSFRDRWKNPDYRRNVLRTVWLGATLWGLGFEAGQRGPAFLDLQIITRTDVEQAAFFFTSSSIGCLVGSLVAGVIFDLLNKSMLLLLCVLGLAFGTIALPWCYLYGLMIAIHFVTALFAGAIGTTGCAEVVRIWGKEGEMAMHSIQFAFALGGVISPLVTEPFLTPTTEEDMDTVTAPSMSVGISNFTSEWISTTPPDIRGNSTMAVSRPLTTNVHYAFIISGGIILLIAVPLTAQFFSDRSRKRRQNKTDEKKEIKQPLPLAVFLFVQGTLCVFYLVDTAVEGTYASFLTTFVVKQLHWSKSSGAQLSSVYWASFAAGRFLCIFVSHVLNSVKLLSLSCCSLFLSFVVFFLFSAHNVDIGVWAMTALVGVSMAPIFPSGFLWMEEELVRVTGRVASSILIASSSGMMVNPIVVGYLMQELTPMWFVYILIIQSALCVGVFFFLLALSRLYLKKHYLVQRTETLEMNVPSLNNNENLTVNGTD